MIHHQINRLLHNQSLSNSSISTLLINEFKELHGITIIEMIYILYKESKSFDSIELF